MRVLAREGASGPVGAGLVACLSAAGDGGGEPVEFDGAHGSLAAPLELDTAGRVSVPGALTLKCL